MAILQFYFISGILNSNTIVILSKIAHTGKTIYVILPISGSLSPDLLGSSKTPSNTGFFHFCLILFRVYNCSLWEN